MKMNENQITLLVVMLILGFLLGFFLAPSSMRVLAVIILAVIFAAVIRVGTSFFYNRFRIILVKEDIIAAVAPLVGILSGLCLRWLIK